MYLLQKIVVEIEQKLFDSNEQMQGLNQNLDTHLLNYNLRLKKESIKAKKIKKSIDQLHNDNSLHNI